MVARTWWLKLALVALCAISEAPAAADDDHTELGGWRVIIQRIVRQNHDRFRRCYESGQRKNPRLRGHVSVELVIAPSGSVTKAARGPTTTLPDAAVVQCVVGVFASLGFPASGAAMRVEYPMDFP